MDRVLLVIGFSAGQIQLIDPISKELSRLYNEEVCFVTLILCHEIAKCHAVITIIF